MKTLPSNMKDISRELYERFDRNSREIELYEMIFVRNIEICNCLERVIVFGKGIEIRQWWCLCGCRGINCRFIGTCVLTLDSWEFVTVRKARRVRIVVECYLWKVHSWRYFMNIWFHVYILILSISCNNLINNYLCTIDFIL